MTHPEGRVQEHRQKAGSLVFASQRRRGEGKHAGDYWRLLLMALLSFAAMYALMYAMVDRLAHVRPNVNQAYMAALMAAPMIFLELTVMSKMYTNARTNFVALGLTLAIGVGAFLGVRQQIAIADLEFARSMIPHHSSAILMCREARLSDPELRRLCFGPQGIVASQEREIAQLEEFLSRN